MDTTFRDTLESDLDELFRIRGRTRENAISREALAALGVTVASQLEGFRSGRLVGRVCQQAESLVGFCSGDTATGEILVLAVLPEYEGRGIGTRLLREVVASLRENGHVRLWLGASVNPASHAHRFYRSRGWSLTGEIDQHGDAIFFLG